MANLTNETFMEELERDHSGFDWDGFDIETYPDVWKISAKTHSRLVHLAEGKEAATYKEVVSTGIDEEYPSLEAAQEAVERIKASWGDTERLITENIYWKKYLGPILPDSYEITKTKSNSVLDLEFKKICREDILKGEKVFPMYLP